MPVLLATSLVAALLVLWLLAALTLRLTHRDRVLPGTTMAGVSLGGTDRAAAGSALGGIDPPEGAVVLVRGERRFTVSASAAGLTVDTDASARRALRSGRRGILDALAVPARALGVGGALSPVLRLDRGAIGRIADTVARRLDQPPFDGGLRIDPASLAVETVPPRAGRELDRRALSREVLQRLSAGGRSTLPLELARSPAPPPAAVERVGERAREYLAAGPLRLVGAGRPVVLGPEQLAGLLTVERVGEGLRLRLAAAPGPARRLGDRVAESRSRPAIDARIEAPAAPVVLDAQGDVSWRPRRADVAVAPGRPGRRLDGGRVARAIAGAIRAGRHRATLPVEPVAPRVGAADARRVRDLIGTFTTRFPCCEPRVTNIRLMGEAIDGTVIAAGEQFSLNGVAGQRTRARGFVPAPFIADGKVVPSVGGGVSQMSTTMYNAAYFAGLRLDAYQPHSFYIDRYPAGREATVDYNSIELLWTNDTRAPVLVRASTTDTSVTVSLYGDNRGRRVSATASERQPVAGGDFAITVTRTIRYADGRVDRQPITTTYQRPPPPD